MYRQSSIAATVLFYVPSTVGLRSRGKERTRCNYEGVLARASRARSVPADTPQRAFHATQTVRTHYQHVRVRRLIQVPEPSASMTTTLRTARGGAERALRAAPVRTVTLTPLSPLLPLAEEEPECGAFALSSIAGPSASPSAPAGAASASSPSRSLAARYSSMSGRRVSCAARAVGDTLGVAFSPDSGDRGAEPLPRRGRPLFSAHTTLGAGAGGGAAGSSSSSITRSNTRRLPQWCKKTCPSASPR